MIGISFLSETVRVWIWASPDHNSTVGGFLYVTVFSLAAGLTISTFRWMVFDRIHHRTGIPEPKQNFGRFQEKLSAYQYLVLTHYNYYKFHSNMMISFAILFVSYLFSHRSVSLWEIIGFLFLEWLFWQGSRDNLRKYYSQGNLLLKESSSSNSVTDVLPDTIE
ncbi:hypothetical protein Pan241w_58250 [Gimesia alba]|uniref:Uncharacterized protein n=1 Tax=Gimesia alba TaxID=2527973 RepID=A0A517RP93_9PLAN|nr:hypothetical protein [Gimesia alba]QDT41763.1 hypothetical protein Pan241w_18260 [Gimesia alba]QDT45698.1 hypothetical protein Pan241w_58250 [Gimesia alba]